MSKGSRPRPYSVSIEELDARHEAIFGVKPKKEPYVPPPLPADLYVKENKQPIDWGTQEQNNDSKS